MPSGSRLGLAAGGAVLAVFGAASAISPMRFTWVNEGLLVSYPWRVSLGLAAAALGLGLVAFAAPARRARLPLAIVAAVAVGFAAQRGAYRLSADPNGLTQRGLLGARTLAWKNVSRVEAGPAEIALQVVDGSPLRIDCSSFTPDERATLDRTLSRRVRESSLDRQSPSAVEPR